MKVSRCEKCKNFERRTWSHYYKPKNYHPIGMTHAFGFCNHYNERCSCVKKCNCKENQYELLGGDEA